MSTATVVELVERACASLEQPRHKLVDAASKVPDRAGLYAIYASAETWKQLELGEPPDVRPLYVGKAEQSLVSRDLNTHFRVGRTGQSTVRRTFAALLRDELGLRGIPRNQLKPEHPANYALSAEHDQALNDWMYQRLELGVWTKADECLDLGAVEVGVLARWSPPLNLKDSATSWNAEVSAARKVMADDARAWIAAHSKSASASSTSAPRVAAGRPKPT